MFQFNITIYLTILLSIMIGCDCNHNLNTAHFTNLNESNTKPVIVLFHGLDSRASCFDNLKVKLNNAFPNASVVALTSVEKANSALFPITEQVNLSFKELSEEVPDLQHRPTLLIGHSQGGLRAYKMLDLYKDQLNVKGIITLATPWEGAPILNADSESLHSTLFSRSVQNDMKKLSIGCGCDVQQQLNGMLQLFKAGFAFPGVKDLAPGSDFLNQVTDTLASETVPILAIGGSNGDFSVFLPEQSKDDFKAIRKEWTYFVVGKTDHTKEHDMTVPLYSQLALGIIPNERENFERFTIRGAIHDEILPLPDNKKSKTILAHPSMFKAVEKFATRVLGVSSKREAAKAA